MSKSHSFSKRIVTMLTIFCFSVTGLVGFIYINNSKEINRLVQIALLIKTQSLYPSSNQSLLQGAARGMVNSLGDPYSVFLDSGEYQDMQNYIQGSFGGIGIFINARDKTITVMNTIPGTPAAKAGMQKNDIIIKINDAFTNDMDPDQAVAMMRGEPGTQVKISVLREEMTKEFNLTREIIETPTVESEVLPGDIGYMYLALFASNTDEAVLKQLQELKNQGIKGLILDMRNNPGGDLESAVNIAKYFVPKGPVVYIVDRFGQVQSDYHAVGPGLELPLVVLIDGGSASASEILSGAIKDRESGVLIGEKTYGKGIVQGVYPLAGNEGLKLTTSKYLTPNKVDIHETGIEPNIVVVVSPEDKEDIQLNKAIEVLQEKIKNP